METGIISLPTVPFTRPIPGGLSVGKIIEIKGSVPYGADVFTINFTKGEDSGSYEADRLLHLSVRFNQQRVVRNARISNAWGAEEIDYAMPFASGKSFLILILVEQNSYKVAVDGQHRWEFLHRSDIHFASHLYINGSVKIDEVRFVDKFFPGPQIGTCMPPQFHEMSKYPQMINNPTIPYYHNFPRGIHAGMMITFNARPFASADRFTINLQSGQSTYPEPDIAFHLDVRFYNSTIIRNTKINTHWETEEKTIPYFPFVPGKNFDMIIKVEDNTFLISVNGQTFMEYKHRTFPLSRFDTLFIENDIVVSFLRIDSF